MIGYKYMLTNPLLGNPVGAIGYVFNQYPDYDNPRALGVQIIFPNGEYDGFSVKEQKRFLKFMGMDLRYADYEFRSVIQVGIDYEKGYWNFD
jgi:hypothetical protein